MLNKMSAAFGYHFVDDYAMRRECVGLLTEYQHGTVAVHVPNVDELIGGLSVDEALQNTRVERKESFQALRQVIHTEIEGAKQENQRAISDL